jgi:hypothetical protein
MQQKRGAFRRQCRDLGKGCNDVAAAFGGSRRARRTKRVAALRPLARTRPLPAERALPHALCNALAGCDTSNRTLGDNRESIQTDHLQTTAERGSD